MSERTIMAAAEAAMYLAETWIDILESSDGKGGGRYVAIDYNKNGESMTDKLKGPDGKWDKSKFYKSCGSVISCDPLIAEKMTQVLDLKRVSRIQTQVIMNGKAKIYFLIAKECEKDAQEARTRINMAMGVTKMKKETFLKEMERRNGSNIVKIGRVDKGLYDIMIDKMVFTFPYFITDNADDTINIFMPGDNEEQFMQEMTNVKIEYSGGIMTRYYEEKKKREDEVSESLRWLLDDSMKVYVVDERYPDQYVWSDGGMYHIMRGGIEVQTINRNDTRENKDAQEKIYNEITGYASIVRFAASTPEKAQEKLDDIRSQAMDDEPEDIMDKAHYYKRGFRGEIYDAIMRTAEEQAAGDEDIT